MKPELYSEQDVETKVIVPTLAALGYNEVQNSQIQLRFQHPVKVHQGREAKTIFADVVVFVSDIPLVVIDAKNPRKYLSENDREQVISYARLIGNVAPYAVLCNGHTWQVFDSILKQQLSFIPAYQELLADIQRRRLTTRQRQGIQEQAKRTLFAIDSARELSRLMRRCHDVIRNLKGYDPTKAFDELSKMLFAKMYEEREIAEGRRLTDQNRFTLATVKAMRKQSVEIVENLWRDTVASDQYREVFSDQETAVKIELPPEAIDEIVGILEEKSLGLTDLDVKGVAFEEFLASTYRGGGLGQYFTPREVVNFMVDLIDPAIGETCIDPACGTGGFLIRVYDVVREKIRTTEFSEQKKKEALEALANTALAGIDWEARAARTCKMNMIIHGDGHAGVYQANSLDLEEVKEKVRKRQRLYATAPAIEEGTFDIVLANPPFGAKDKTRRILDHYELGRGSSEKREVLMLERCIRLLRPGGRMAVVIPEGILSNKNDRRIREYILRQCIVKAVIRLPQDAFKMSEGAANTSILYAVRKDPDRANQKQSDIFFARAEHIGVSPAGRPTEQNDLLAIHEHYRQFEQGKWTGIELRATTDGNIEIARATPAPEGSLWLEPEVNRTSLLYDRLSYVVKSPLLSNRFSYTYFHPRYYQIADALRDLSVDVVSMESLCRPGFPRRGKKPSDESVDGIPVLKVRNITGQGIDFDTDYAPDNDQTRRECARAMIFKNDILITSTGEGTIGRVDVYRLPKDEALVDSHVTICRLRKGVHLRYIVEFLRSEYGQVQMLRHVSGSTGQTELLIDHIKSLQIPLPPMEVQKAVVAQMDDARKAQDDLLARAEELRSESAKTMAESRQTMMSLLGASRRLAAIS